MNDVPINGVAINAAADSAADGNTQLKPLGLELGIAGTALLVMQARAGEGGAALALGDPAAKRTLLPPGLDLATGGTAVARYNTALKPNGLEMAAAGKPLALNVVAAAGSQPMEFGTHRVQQGVDVELGIDGLDMGLPGLHLALGGRQPEEVRVIAAGAQPLELGQPQIKAGAYQAFAPEGVNALALGAVGVSATAFPAGAANVLQPGMPAVVASATAKGWEACELGLPRLVVGIAIPGLDMASSSPAGAGTEGMTVQAAGAEPLELGELQTLGQTARARQHFPLALGQPSIVGRWVC